MTIFILLEEGDFVAAYRSRQEAEKAAASNERVETMNTYQREGYDNRRAYLLSLAVDTGVDIDIVTALSDLLGEDEDFDGLVTSLEDYAAGY